MRKLAITTILLFLTLCLQAQQTVRFSIADGLDNAALAQKIGRNISLLLTELNLADEANRQLRLNNIPITTNASKSLQMLWNNLHFSCDRTRISQHCLTSSSGYEIRNIDITLHPVYDGYEGELSRELTISLSPSGLITGVYLAMQSQSYNKILREGKTVTDKDRRMSILSFVENFRTCYEEKDIESLREIYSDDALIITGRVIMKRSVVGEQARLSSTVVYNTQRKEEYLRRLQQTFRRNRYIKVDFSDPEVERSGSNPNFYAVTLHQHWQSDHYEDDGYLLLLWEFRDDADPIIHVRTWQPDYVGNRRLEEKERFSINDFEIPKIRK